MDFCSQQEVSGKCLHHLSTKDDPRRDDFNLPECCTGGREMKMEWTEKRNGDDTLVKSWNREGGGGGGGGRGGGGG